MAGRVLVTRPEPGAARTAARLRRMGYVPVVCPLTAIVPLPAGLRDTDYAAVAVTSVNALRHAPPQLLAAGAGKPCFAVGARTAEEAQDAGFRDVRDGGGDGARLASTIVATLPGASRILYLCGRVRRPDFERSLTSAGFPVVAAETYDTVAVPPDPAALGAEPIDAALVYSAASAEALMRLIAADRSPARWSATRFLCLSQRVAEPLKTLGGVDIRVAREPSEDALLMLLEAAG